MKRLFFFSVLVLLIGCRDYNEVVVTPPVPEQVQQPYEKPYLLTDSQKFIYDNAALPEITVEVPLTEWNKFLSYYDQNPDNEEYVSGKFAFIKNGTTETLDNIGFRLRGNTSRRRPEGNRGEMHNATNPDWHHASFTVSFKKFNKTQLFHQSEKLILKWFKDDAMYAREVFSYDLFEKFGVWTAPQSSYCRLTIKVAGGAKAAYFGVYQMIEPVDDTYLNNRTSFFTTTGNLWKANWGATLKDPSQSNMGIENITLTSNYTPIYDYKGSKSNLAAAKTQLSDFITQVNSKTGDDFKNYISQKMDVNLFLKTYAVNVTVGMWDDYWSNSNNFYFYFDAAGKFYFIPYDYDNTLGTSLMMKDSGIQDPLNWGNNVEHPLVAKVLSIPEYRTQYIKYLNDLMDKKYDLFYVNYAQQRIQNWQNSIASYVSNDTGEDMEIKDVPANWGNCGFYRLRGSSADDNYFIRKASSIPKN
ncbi:hypothetical protein GCM10010992_01040 [Cloacibacterium rupense]|uniref:CotH protein n=1 Tax=Cloacibacterium rupense TaxID=517423 RepID=A0ABQ2NEE9_9FLAO|nr:CotH kinase family protein [Cloacibacterium rupense]GGP01247.1 hypothetical protein GCM10010992_01040 [Cloacibacterium rupense]